MSKTQTKPTLTGIVTKKSSAQTVRVEMKVTKVHPIYKKRYSQTRHVLAHDPENKAEIGQTVTVVACRPISKTKSWQVV